MPYWLVGSTFYGQWLPGDERGFVTNVRDRRADEPDSAARFEHSGSGDAYDTSMPGLESASRERLRSPPVALGLPEAEQLFGQFKETTGHRGWVLEAVSVMFNHFHLVVEAPAKVDKAILLRDFKSYGSRRLNRHFGLRESGTWWTESGSARVVENLAAAIFYVCHRQPSPLLVWSRLRGRIAIEESHPENVFRGEAHLNWPKK
jgi:hypothetical protein